MSDPFNFLSTCDVQVYEYREEPHVLRGVYAFQQAGLDTIVQAFDFEVDLLVQEWLAYRSGDQRSYFSFDIRETEKKYSDFDGLFVAPLSGGTWAYIIKNSGAFMEEIVIFDYEMDELVSAWRKYKSEGGQ